MMLKGGERWSGRAAVGEDERAGSVEHAADTVCDADAHVRKLGRGFASNLPYRLLDREHAVHARVRVRETAAVRVQREIASWRCPHLLEEGTALALPDKPERLQREHRRVREGVVEHRVVNVRPV